MAYTWYTFWHFIRERALPAAAAILFLLLCCIVERERERERERVCVCWLGTSAVRQIKFKVIVSFGPAVFEPVGQELSDALSENKSYDFQICSCYSCCCRCLVLAWFMAKYIWQFTVDFDVMPSLLFQYLFYLANTVDCVAFHFASNFKNDYKLVFEWYLFVLCHLIASLEAGEN